jgi:hypothetical protein
MRYETKTAITAASLNLTQLEVAERWRLSGRTLEKWRQRRVGPRYLRVGGKVLYPLSEIERFEAAALRGGV